MAGFEKTKVDAGKCETPYECIFHLLARDIEGRGYLSRDIRNFVATDYGSIKGKRTGRF